MSSLPELTYQRGLACYPGQPPLQVADLLPEEKMEAEHNLEEYKFNSSLRPQSTQSIAKWLDNNYHYEDGICLPRSTIYEHYVDHCQRENLQPVNAASFGKIIRQQYPSLTTRRLGTRGQSKYHYFGLGIKPTSRYYTADYLEKHHGQGTTRKEPETKKAHAYYASKEKPSAVLPVFPDVNILELPSQISRDKLHTFMVMYRAHCQRILDSVVRATFNEVENFLFHFWQGMPSHLHPILASEIVTDLIAICDTTLYKAISNVYITTPLQSIPENVAQEVHHFASSLKSWLEGALKGLPDSLKEVKYRIADVFKKNLQRQRSLMHLADATRNALHGDDPLEQLGVDWGTLDIQNIFTHTLFAVQPLHLSDHCTDLVPEFLEEFGQVISEQKTSVEDFIVWVEGVIERCISKKVSASSRKEVGRTFLLTWNFFTSKIVREFTLMSAPSFGTFHLIHMLIDDYILHTLELMLETEQERKYTERIHYLESGTLSMDKAKDIAKSSSVTPTTTNILRSSTSPDLPLIAEPPSAFSFTPNLTSGKDTSIASRTDITPEESFVGILPTPLGSLQTDVVGSGLRGSNASLPGVGRGDSSNSDSQTGPTTLQGLISSHGIGAYSMVPPTTSTRDNSLQSRQQMHDNLVLSNSSNSVAGSDGRIKENSIVPSVPTSSSFTHPGRRQESSLSLSFSHPPPPLQSGSSLPFLSGPPALPPHLQSDHHSLQFGTSSRNLNNPANNTNILGEASNPSRNISQMMNQTGKDLSPQQPQQQNLSMSTTSNPQNEHRTFSTASNLPGVATPMQMSLAHPVMAPSGNLPGTLPNPSSLPLFPGMPNMYSYPYPAGLPTLPATVSSSMPPFPSQGLVSRYPPYVSPSLYGNNQPPITNRNYTS